MKMSMRLIIIITASFITTKCSSQLSSADSAVYNASLNNALLVYHHALAPEPLLYDGMQYMSYDYQMTEGSPYFQSAQLRPGAVFYNDVLFTNVPMLYDLVSDKLIINSPGKAFLIQLNSERVAHFSLLDHQFIRLVLDSANNINTGFYELLYDGKTQVLKKQIKTIQERINVKVEKYVQEVERHYIKKGNRYFSVSTKQNVLQLLADKKKELKQYIRKNKLNIRKDKDNTLVKIAAYYDEITK